MRKSPAASIAALIAALAIPGPAGGAGDPEIAALQVGLRAQGVYAGTVDGVLGSSTRTALRRFQRRAGLPPDGMPGPKTRAAFGGYGRSAPLGKRQLVRGMRGWDVAALQFALAWHGFPSGAFDGSFGLRTEAALRRFQTWAGRKADGKVGRGTVAALRAAPPRCPIALAAPVVGAVEDGFGPRGTRFHAGLDFVAPVGTPVTAAAAGRVAFAGWDASGWGNLVVVKHAAGVRTLYAHLSRIDVRVGQRVPSGSALGTIGASGNATGPHLHFEVLVRGAAVDPAAAF